MAQYSGGKHQNSQKKHFRGRDYDHVKLSLRYDEGDNHFMGGTTYQREFTPERSCAPVSQYQSPIHQRAQRNQPLRRSSPQSTGKVFSQKSYTGSFYKPQSHARVEEVQPKVSAVVKDQRSLRNIQNGNSSFQSPSIASNKQDWPRQPSTREEHSIMDGQDLQEKERLTTQHQMQFDQTVSQPSVQQDQCPQFKSNAAPLCYSQRFKHTPKKNYSQILIGSNDSLSRMYLQRINDQENLSRGLQPSNSKKFDLPKEDQNFYQRSYQIEEQPIIRQDQKVAVKEAGRPHTARPSHLSKTDRLKDQGRPYGQCQQVSEHDSQIEEVQSYGQNQATTLDVGAQGETLPPPLLEGYQPSGVLVDPFTDQAAEDIADNQDLAEHQRSLQDQFNRSLSKSALTDRSHHIKKSLASQNEYGDTCVKHQRQGKLWCSECINKDKMAVRSHSKSIQSRLDRQQELANGQHQGPELFSQQLNKREIQKKQSKQGMEFLERDLVDRRRQASAEKEKLQNQPQINNFLDQFTGGYKYNNAQQRIHQFQQLQQDEHNREPNTLPQPKKLILQGQTGTSLNIKGRDPLQERRLRREMQAEVERQVASKSQERKERQLLQAQADQLQKKNYEAMVANLQELENRKKQMQLQQIRQQIWEQKRMQEEQREQERDLQEIENQRIRELQDKNRLKDQSEKGRKITKAKAISQPQAKKSLARSSQSRAEVYAKRLEKQAPSTASIQNSTKKDCQHKSYSQCAICKKEQPKGHLQLFC